MGRYLIQVNGKVYKCTSVRRRTAVLRAIAKYLKENLDSPKNSLNLEIKILNER